MGDDMEDIINDFLVDLNEQYQVSFNKLRLELIQEKDCEAILKFLENLRFTNIHIDTTKGYEIYTLTIVSFHKDGHVVDLNINALDPKMSMKDFWVKDGSYNGEEFLGKRIMISFGFSYKEEFFLDRIFLDMALTKKCCLLSGKLHDSFEYVKDRLKDILLQKTIINVDFDASTKGITLTFDDEKSITLIYPIKALS
jgi:hypothetical protein